MVLRIISIISIGFVALLAYNSLLKVKLDGEQNRSQGPVYFKQQRRQQQSLKRRNSPCRYSSQCEDGLTCLKLLGVSSCQPSYTKSCFDEAYRNLTHFGDLPERIMKTVHVDGDYTQKMQLDTQDTAQRLAKDVAPRFSKDFLDFYTSFHRCAIKSPDFKLPSSNRTILGVDLPFNKVKFGTTLDLGAFIGGTNYVGITADFRKVDFSDVSLTDLDFSGVDLKGIEFEGFGNLCSGFKLGVGSKFSFAAGMTTTNVTSQEEIPETPLEIFQVLFRGKGGFKNFCTSLDIGGGLGVGSKYLNM